MRTDLVEQLVETLWNDPNLARTYRAAMREYALTEEELTALDRGITDRTLAAKEAASEEALPESLEEIAPLAPELQRGTGRRQRTLDLDALCIKADGHTLDIPGMQRRYAEKVLAQGSYQAREELTAQVAWHVGQVCKDLSDGGKKKQVRMAVQAATMA